MVSQGVKLIALRCAGFNNVDLEAARSNNVKVVRVPAYSPHAVAEHAVAMIMALNRKTHKAYNRIREQNFSLNGLMGFDLWLARPLALSVQETSVRYSARSCWVLDVASSLLT